MLRVLISIAIALPLYELLRYRILRRVRESQRRKARSYAEEHGVRVDLFKFGGKQLVREELLNDRAILRAMEAAADAGERPTDVRQRVEEYIDEIVPAFSLAAYFQLGMRLARTAIRAVYRPVIVRPPPPLPHDATAVFLINHRSNFDYVVVGWALARRVAISYAVGEWARVFPLDALFRAFGGFFVRRGKAAAARIRRAGVRRPHPVPRPAPVARDVAADGRAAARASEGDRRHGHGSDRPAHPGDAGVARRPCRPGPRLRRCRRRPGRARAGAALPPRRGRRPACPGARVRPATGGARCVARGSSAHPGARSVRRGIARGRGGRGDRPVGARAARPASRARAGERPRALWIPSTGARSALLLRPLARRAGAALRPAGGGTARNADLGLCHGRHGRQRRAATPRRLPPRAPRRDPGALRTRSAQGGRSAPSGS